MRRSETAVFTTTETRLSELKFLKHRPLRPHNPILPRIGLL